MRKVLVTGSCGLVGSEAVRFYIDKGYQVVGVDNDMRAAFFGPDASTAPVRTRLQELPGYIHIHQDIRDKEATEALFKQVGPDLELILHAAAQPSHDWAARDPLTDFSVNAQATLNLLELTRQWSPEAVFIFTSTNKVYGDNPNRLPLVALKTRYELATDHPYSAFGIDESMSLDHCTHSLFGVSKTSADLLVQEYGRYFGLKTACFRGGCLTGPGHAGTELHGFLAYLVRATLLRIPYRVIGYNGKQVRDNIHSLDLIRAFDSYFQNPRPGEVYNIGGARQVNCSMLEAIELVQKACNVRLQWTYEEQPRIGDHQWWISDTRKFEAHYPEWRREFDLMDIIVQIRDKVEEGLTGE